MCDSYQCILCDYSASQQCIVNHYLAKHNDYFFKKPSVVKHCKYGAMFPMEVKLNKQPIEVQACISCKKFWAREGCATAHRGSCPNKKAHKDFFTTETTSEISNEGNEELLKQIKKLERTILEQKEELEANEVKVNAFDELMMFLHQEWEEDKRDEFKEQLQQKVDGIDWDNYL